MQVLILLKSSIGATVFAKMTSLQQTGDRSTHSARTFERIFILTSSELFQKTTWLMFFFFTESMSKTLAL